MNSLNVRAWISLVVLAIAMGLLLFIPAGTLDYREAWVYLGVLAPAKKIKTNDSYDRCRRMVYGSRKVMHLHELLEATDVVL